MLEIIYISSVFQITLFLYQISVYSDFSTVVVNYPKIICFSYENYGYFSLLAIKRRIKQESMYVSINWDLSTPLENYPQYPAIENVIFIHERISVRGWEQIFLYIFEEWQVAQKHISFCFVTFLFSLLINE